MRVYELRFLKMEDIFFRKIEVLGVLCPNQAGVQRNRVFTGCGGPGDAKDSAHNNRPLTSVFLISKSFLEGFKLGRFASHSCVGP